MKYNYINNRQKAINLLLEERTRQIEKEGYSHENDLKYQNEELSKAAGCYVLPEYERNSNNNGIPFYWPWIDECWKPTPNDRIKELTKAGALILAEIERILNSGSN